LKKQSQFEARQKAKVKRKKGPKQGKSKKEKCKTNPICRVAN
jgi:hypothetical protein